MTVLKVEDVSDEITRLTLNRPDKLNALSSELLKQIAQETRNANRKDKRVLIFEGEGSAFTSGADLDEDAERIHLFQDITRAVREFEGVVIGKLHGYVVGGGFEFTLSFDLRYVQTGTTFKMTESEIGVAISNASTTLLPLTVGSGVARELIFTSRDLPAEEAVEHGLVAGVYDEEELEQKVLDVANDIVKNKSSKAIWLNKRGLNHAHSIEDALDYEEMLGRIIAESNENIDW